MTDGAAPVRWQFGVNAGQQAAFQPPTVVDTTGAGDAFTAGLLHRWAAAPQERIRFAAACGALVCGGAGGIDPQPTQAQVEAFLGGELSQSAVVLVTQLAARLPADRAPAVPATPPPSTPPAARASSSPAETVHRRSCVLEAIEIEVHQLRLPPG